MQNMVNVKNYLEEEFPQGTGAPGSHSSSKQGISKKVSLTWQEWHKLRSIELSFHLASFSNSEMLLWTRYIFFSFISIKKNQNYEKYHKITE